MWKEGFMTVSGIKFYWEAKIYDERSQYGIDGGRISKLLVKYYETNDELSCYDRGWVLEPTTPEAKTVVNIIIRRFN